jgi:hypothetical protein
MTKPERICIVEDGFNHLAFGGLEQLSAKNLEQSNLTIAVQRGITVGVCRPVCVIVVHAHAHRDAHGRGFQVINEANERPD